MRVASTKDDNKPKVEFLVQPPPPTPSTEIGRAKMAFRKIMTIMPCYKNEISHTDALKAELTK